MNLLIATLLTKAPKLEDQKTFHDPNSRGLVLLGLQILQEHSRSELKRLDGCSYGHLNSLSIIKK